MSQKERVRDILRSAGDDGVCSLAWYSLSIPNGRTRVYELRDDDGLFIETIACTAEHEKGTPTHVRYRWLWHGNPRQLQLSIT